MGRNKSTLTAEDSVVTDKKKKKKIFDAARKLFLAQGYGATSMEAIAREADVSKATLYAHFSAKEQLLATVIDHDTGHLTASLAKADLKQGDVRTALTTFLHKVVIDILLGPDSLAINRIVVAEVIRFPQIGRVTYEHGLKKIVELLAAYLRDMHDSRVLNVPDAPLAAELLVGTFFGLVFPRRTMGIPESSRNIKRLINAAVDDFMVVHGV